jgi:quercetin dioxygenase-like cupin family protein
MKADALPGPAQSHPKVIVHAPGEGEQIWFLDNLLTVKASGATGSAFAVLENRLPANSQTPFHRHDAEDEAFYVLEGSLTVYLDDGRRITAGPGSYVHLPCGTAHGFRTHTAVRMLVVCGTEGFVEMTREAGVSAERNELPPPAELDFARLERACAHNAIKILGPLPE